MDQLIIHYFIQVKKFSPEPLSAGIKDTDKNTIFIPYNDIENQKNFRQE